MTGFDPLELLPADAPLGFDTDLQASIDLLEADPDEGEPQPFGFGWAFDFETGQFLRHGGSPAIVRDIDNLRVWIEKTLRAHRGAHPIYSDAYGTDQPDEGIGEPFTAEIVGRLTQSIKAALAVHDRVEEAIDFRFTGGSDSDVLFVTFTVVVDDEDIQFNSLPLGESF